MASNESPLSDHLDIRILDGTVYVRANGNAERMLKAIHRTGDLHALSAIDMVFLGSMWATAGLEIVHAAGGSIGPVVEAVVAAGKSSGAEMSRAVIAAARKEKS